MQGTKTDKILEVIIAVLAVTGSALVATTVKQYQLYGFSCWIVADLAGLAFTARKKFWFLYAQYVVFLCLACAGVLYRL